jgi:hypothetical protein
MQELDAFAQERKPQYKLRSTGDAFYAYGQKVEIFDQFVKVGNNIIPRNQVVVTKSPATVTTVTYKFTY